MAALLGGLQGFSYAVATVDGPNMISKEFEARKIIDVQGEAATGPLPSMALTAWVLWGIYSRLEKIGSWM